MPMRPLKVWCATFPTNDFLRLEDDDGSRAILRVTESQFDYASCAVVLSPEKARRMAQWLNEWADQAEGKGQEEDVI